MSSEKYLMFSLDDDSSKKLGEIISNETARKIMNLVAEKELSASEIANNLKLPLNTVGYNLTKLVEAGLLIESKSFWSVKGKKIPVYEVARKHIVISPKKTYPSRIGTILPVIIVALIFSIFVLTQNNSVVQQNLQKNSDTSAETAPALATSAGNGADVVNGLGLVTWFLIGIWILIVAFVIWSYRRK